MRAIIFSDLHVHPHGNDWKKVDDAIAVIDWVREQAVEREIDTVFFLGDLFHVRGYLYPSALARTYEAIKEMKDGGIDVYLIVGNHDMPHKYTTADNSVTTLNGVATVVDRPAVYEDGKYNFWMLPYVESEVALTNAVKRLAGEQATGKKNILLAHLDVKGALFHGTTTSNVGVTPELLDECFDMTITGHYHRSQKVTDKILYVGSPYQINWGESNDTKGIWIFDDGELEFVENTFSPKHIYATPETIGPHIQDHYVSVSVDSEVDVTKVREEALAYEPRSVRVKVVPAGNRMNRTKIENDIKDVRALLSEWVDKMAKNTTLDRDRLLNTGLGIVNGVQ